MESARGLPTRLQSYIICYRAGNGRRGKAIALQISLRRWIEYLAAILLGNLIYYKSLVPYLPQWLQHREFRPDGGMALDFLVCVAVYGLIRLGAKLSG